ncbi:MAG TPA: type II toxin-antitoxin system RelE/ParE family toxin [Thermoanaerobaculia bacterium]|jgi:plasmid stabilization system protein ParE|nr:type II toxin-antitoxin system RelE/ParE family toxin [Thermoanaerobaculia bacterium]
MKSATFNPLAARELGEAVEYYDEARRGLGEEFLHEVERAIAFLDQYPQAAPKVGREVRRLVLGRFPYSVIYRDLGAGQIRILAVAHQKRRPRYWTRRH